MANNFSTLSEWGYHIREDSQNVQDPIVQNIISEYIPGMLVMASHVDYNKTHFHVGPNEDKNLDLVFKILEVKFKLLQCIPHSQFTLNVLNFLDRILTGVRLDLPKQYFHHALRAKIMLLQINADIDATCLSAEFVEARTKACESFIDLALCIENYGSLPGDTATKEQLMTQKTYTTYNKQCLLIDVYKKEQKIHLADRDRFLRFADELIRLVPIDTSAYEDTFMASMFEFPDE